MSKKVAIIGTGFSSLSAAIHLAFHGYEVNVYEKHNQPGGRARQFEAEGFVFDMGPSWYWMPDVFEKFFAEYGHQPSDYYTMKRLDPAFRMYFGKNDFIDVPDKQEDIYALFEKLEEGSAAQLKKFMEGAAYKYEVGVHDLVHKPSLSLMEFMDLKLAKGAIKLELFKDFRSHVQKYFKNERLRTLMEFPVLFLGATPQNTPALYSLMNYAGLFLGTFYPEGGFYAVIKGMEKLAKDLGVQFNYNANISNIEVNEDKAVGMNSSAGAITFDGLISGADYNHTEQQLLPKSHRNYSNKYWENRTMAPSSLLFYLGINKKVPSIKHHNLFFDQDFDKHAIEIYEQPNWPTAPLFYICCPSKSEDGVAPKDGENIFILMPLAPGIEDNEELREEYFNRILDRFENITGESIRENIVYKKSYCVNDFIEDYNAFKGNAYGLANTLKQTAILKPSLRNKKLKNFLYTGQLTVPGPGVPPSLISGQVAAKEMIKYLSKN